MSPARPPDGGSPPSGAAGPQGRGNSPSPWRLLPQSLAGRVFALYALALAVFVFAGLALFYRYQFALELEGAQQRAESLVQVIAPTVSDSAVIGDYDTIERTLARAIDHSDFATAVFIDVKGHGVRSLRQEAPDVHPPAWLAAMVAERLYDANLPITAGGRDYGVLRLSFASDRVAGNLWRQARFALLLGLAALAGGLLALRMPLRRWLGDFERLQAFEAALAHGAATPGGQLGSHAPTELKQTFDVLNRVAASAQAQREQAAVTLATIGDAVLTLDAEGRVVLSNPAASQVLGRPADTLRAADAPALLPELFAGGRPDAAGWRGRRVRIAAADGRERVLDTTLSPVAGPDGAPSGHVLACRDVSDEHALEQRIMRELAARESAMAAMRNALEAIVPNVQRPSGADDIEALSLLVGRLATSMRERGEQLGAIFELSPDGFVSFDAERCVSYVSPAFARLTGIAVDEVLGLVEADFSARLGRQAGPGAAPLDLAALRIEAGDADRRHVLELQRPQRRVLELALRQADGGTVSQVLLLRDVTHETEVDQMKSEFLATAAHELRTPMASIYGFTELMLLRPMTPERQRQTLETVHRQTGLMIHIVNELLDLARIEARRGQDFDIETLELGALLQAVVHDFRPPEGREPPRVQAPAAPLAVRGDRLKLTQAISNVLSNAYKYSPQGGPVLLTLAATPEGAASLAVRDHGIGMTPAQLARVCERFFRADTSGAIPGTGLGMSIVKEIVELHGGSLGLASTPGEGTTVTLTLPAAG